MHFTFPEINFYGDNGVSIIHMVMQKKHNRCSATLFQRTKMILPRLINTHYVRCPQHILNARRNALVSFAERYNYRCVLRSPNGVHYVNNPLAFKNVIDMYKNNVIVLEPFAMHHTNAPLHGFRVTFSTSKTVRIRVSEIVLTVNNNKCKDMICFKESNVDLRCTWKSDVQDRLRQFYDHNRHVLPKDGHIDVCCVNHGQYVWITDVELK